MWVNYKNVKAQKCMSFSNSDYIVHSSVDDLWCLLYLLVLIDKDEFLNSGENDIREFVFRMIDKGYVL